MFKKGKSPHLRYSSALFIFQKTQSVIHRFHYTSANFKWRSRTGDSFFSNRKKNLISFRSSTLRSWTSTSPINPLVRLPLWKILIKKKSNSRSHRFLFDLEIGRRVLHWDLQRCILTPRRSSEILWNSRTFEEIKMIRRHSHSIFQCRQLIN